jgi:hypothetical protein
LNFLGEAQLSVMRAMLGEITPEIRSVTVEVNGRHIIVRVYHDGVAGDDLWDDFDSAMTDVYADFPSEGARAITLEYELIRCDAPAAIPALGLPIFARNDTQFREWLAADAGLRDTVRSSRELERAPSPHGSFSSPREQSGDHLRRWMRRGAVTGALCGLALGVYVDWYYVHGAGSHDVDSGAAHGLLLGLLGFPFSFAVAYGYERVGLVLSVAATWALVGATLSGAAALMAGRRTTPPPEHGGGE